MLAAEAQRAPRGFTLACHSEELSDEDSAFNFPFERIGKSAKQMLHFVSA